MPRLPQPLIDAAVPWRTVECDVGRAVDLCLEGALTSLRLDLEKIDRWGIDSVGARGHLGDALDRLEAQADGRGTVFESVSAASWPAVPFVAHALEPGRWVRIDAPLGIATDAAGQATRLTLTDYPPYLRMRGDAELRLDADLARTDFQEWLRQAGPWWPLCRVAGVVQGAGASQSLGLLRLRVRMPRALDESVEDALRLASATARAAVEARLTPEPGWARRARSTREERASDRQAPSTTRGPLLRPAEEIALDPTERLAIESIEHDPYGIAVGFWSSLAALLPRCVGRLPPPLRRTLLEDFDAAFGPAWRELAAVLEHALPLRLTGERLDALREQLDAALNDKPPDDGPADRPQRLLGQGSGRAAVIRPLQA